MTTTRRQTTTPQPPADAVAKDAHWAATQARLDRRTRPVKTLTICDNAEVKRDLASARYVVGEIKAQLDADPDPSRLPELRTALTKANKSLDAAQEAFDAEAIVLRFQALEREDFEALKRAHPPTEEQATEGADWNIDTFAPALISASSLDGMPEEAAVRYLATWGPSEAVQLYDTAWAVQGESRMDLGKG